MTPKKILIISNKPSCFVKGDIRILSSVYTVKTYFIYANGSFSDLFKYFKFLFYLIRNVRKFKLYYCWFADYYTIIVTLFAKIFNRKTIIVLGGYDVVKDKKLRYGGHIKKIRSLSIKWSSTLADLLLPVSNYTLKLALKNISPKIKSKSKIVYNGVDTSFYTYEKHSKRDFDFLTVATLNTEARARIKNFQLYVNLARQMPEYRFAAIGVDDRIKNLFLDQPLPNLEVKNAMEKEELKKYYQRSKVICLLSEIESFGLSLAEGMACGCIPVTFADIGSKELVNLEYGVVIYDRKKTGIRESLEKAIDLSEYREENHQHIRDHFSLNKRKNELIKFIK